MSRKRVLQAGIIAGLLAVTTFGAVGTAQALPRRCAQLQAAAASEWSAANRWWSVALSYQGVDQAKFYAAWDNTVIYINRGKAADKRAASAGC
ncbi:hypothetical protein J5X84_33685 [Streptosporangiaceae bacterium NEAU-GS5]|nr:hypothetical protein [Streptosporangiaceae bacterium NEAU-GS5]